MVKFNTGNTGAVLRNKKYKESASLKLAFVVSATEITQKSSSKYGSKKMAAYRYTKTNCTNK